MSDKVELIAVAQVNNNGTTATFVNNYGFKSASRSSAGIVVLELDHRHDVAHQVPLATRLNTTSGEIAVAILDDKHLQVSTFNEDDQPIDTPFAIQIQRVRS